MRFNRNPVLLSPVREYNSRLIEGTPNLRRASLSDAALFGGPLVRAALERAPLAGDRRHVIVDTKVSMLMPGWYPAIPGWHTDGVPRGDDADPAGSGEPSLSTQEAFDEYPSYRPIFHTLIVGNPCLTQFLGGPMELALGDAAESSELYSEMTRQVENIIHPPPFVSPPVGAWASWDWWNIHRAVEATERGWRLLIRVTEGRVPPASEGFIRAQNQVYVPKDFGW